MADVKISMVVSGVQAPGEYERLLSAVVVGKPELCFSQQNSGQEYQEDGEGSTFPHDKLRYQRTAWEQPPGKEQEEPQII